MLCGCNVICQHVHISNGSHVSAVLSLTTFSVSSLLSFTSHLASSLPGHARQVQSGAATVLPPTSIIPKSPTCQHCAHLRNFAKIPQDPPPPPPALLPWHGKASGALHERAMCKNQLMTQLQQPPFFSFPSAVLAAFSPAVVVPAVVLPASHPCTMSPQCCQRGEESGSATVIHANLIFSRACL